MNFLPRRTFIKSGIALVATGFVGSWGLSRAPLALAAEYPTTAFGAKKVEDAIKGLYGSAQVTVSDAIKLKTPPVAENGATVPITINTKLANVESIAILVEKNSQPLVTAVNLSGADSYFSTFIKMAQTSDVHVVVKAGGKLYTTKAAIKVTAGGCGG